MKSIFQFVFHCVFLRTALRFFCGYSLQNRNVYKQAPQFVLVANHNSHLDTLALFASIPMSLLHSLHVVAASDYFGKNRLVIFLMRWCFNAVLIRRKRTEVCEGPDPMEQMKALLQQGKSILIFPEGTRGAPGHIEPFKPGIGKLLQAFPHIPCIPAYISGTETSLPKGSLFPLPIPIRISLGSLLYAQPGPLSNTVEWIERELRSLGKIKGMEEENRGMNALASPQDLRISN